MYSVFAAELMIWSIACMAKLKVMNSTIGFKAAHRRADADAGKAMLGDRRIDHALGAEFLQQALGDLVGALIFGDLLAHHEHVGSRRISSAMASRSASRMVWRDHLGAFGHFRRGIARRRPRAWAPDSAFCSCTASVF
jgi:hypothetical protein